MLVITRDEIKAGLLNGRTLIQEEWADHSEIEAVDQLVNEGIAQATPWEYRDNFQCERRKITLKNSTL